MPKPVQQSMPKPVQQSMPKPVQQSMPKVLIREEILPSASITTVFEPAVPNSGTSPAHLEDKNIRLSLKTHNNITFFAPKSLNEIAKDKVIHRNKFPYQVIQLLDALRQNIPDTRIYLTGAAPSNLLDGIYPNDYDILILNTNIYLVNELLQKWNLRAEIRSMKFPIIFCDLGNGITLDFTVKMLYPNDVIDQVLEDDFSERDFNLNALYCEITKEDSFRTFSFVNAIEARNNKVIVSIQNPEQSFKQDPTRIFRLAKLLIANPSYQLEDELAEYIKTVQSNWQDLLKQYIVAEKGNIDRLTFAIRKLFFRYEYQDINNALLKLNLLTAFTGNAQASIQKACSKIEYSLPENKFIHWMLANILQGFDEGKEQNKFPLHPFIRLFQQEEASLQYIYNLEHGEYSNPDFYIPGLHGLISQFKLDNRDLNRGHVSEQGLYL
jgi:tRNA nucleotidyltransferase/poly(A) polymerase